MPQFSPRTARVEAGLSPEALAIVKPQQKYKAAV